MLERLLLDDIAVVSHHQGLLASAEQVKQIPKRPRVVKLNDVEVALQLSKLEHSPKTERGRGNLKVDTDPGDPNSLDPNHFLRPDPFRKREDFLLNLPVLRTSAKLQDGLLDAPVFFWEEGFAHVEDSNLFFLLQDFSPEITKT